MSKSKDEIVREILKKGFNEFEAKLREYYYIIPRTDSPEKYVEIEHVDWSGYEDLRHSIENFIKHELTLKWRNDGGGGEMSEQNKPKELREILGVALGEASMCWHSTPPGVFDSRHASEIVNKTEQCITTLFREKARRIAHEAVPKKFFYQGDSNERLQIYKEQSELLDETHENIDAKFDAWGESDGV